MGRSLREQLLPIATGQAAMCGRKNAYHGEGYTKRLAERLSIARGVKLVAYQCVVCHAFHLTKMSQE